MPYEDSVLLQKANGVRSISEYIRRLSADLQQKSSLMSSFTDMAAGQSRHIASLNTADTVLWDPSTTRLSSYSTPNHQSSSEVRGRQRFSDGAASPPCLSLSSPNATLATDTPVHPAGAPAVPSTPVDPTNRASGRSYMGQIIRVTPPPRVTGC